MAPHTLGLTKRVPYYGKGAQKRGKVWLFAMGGRGAGGGGGIEVAAKDHTFSLLSIPFQSITYCNENPTNIYILRHLLLPRLSWLSSIPTSY